MMPKLNDVESFWNSNPCMARLYHGNKNKITAFTKIEDERYSRFSGILKYALFKSFKGKKVLEVGCGIGSDGIQFARNGACYTGVDLTNAAVSIAKERFELFGQKGEIIKVDTESLPFPDNYFNHVYSFGVIHHSPNPENIVNEIHRVLKPGGSINIMLYNRTSFYYFIEVKLMRKLFFMFCEKKIFWNRLFRMFGESTAKRFESFRQKLEEMKAINARPTTKEWISMHTDDVFCPLAGVYSKRDAQKLFIRFREFKSSVWFIDRDNWFLWLVLGRFMPRSVQNWLEFNFGWFRMIQAEK